MTATWNKPAQWMLMAGLVVLAGAYFFAVFQPQQRACTALQAELASTQQRSLAAPQQAARLLGLRQSIDADRQRLADWQRSLPAKRELGRLLSAVSNAAEEAQVKVQRFAPQQPQPMAALWQVPIEMECVGQFDELWQLLTGIEQLPAFIEVSELQWERAVATAQSPQALQCRLKLVVFADQGMLSDQDEQANDR